MMSPGCTLSGRMTISSPTAQLAFLTSVTDHFPSCSLARSVRPAQFGQSNIPPFLIPAGISISCPHPVQDALGIGLLLGPPGPCNQVRSFPPSWLLAFPRCACLLYEPLSVPSMRWPEGVGSRPEASDPAREGAH